MGPHMEAEIITVPFRVSLIGRSGAVEGRCFGARGRLLMDAMWSEVRDRGIQTRGVNHWVYLPEDRLFTGVEPDGPLEDDGGLETMEVVLTRYFHHVHVGPYSKLPEVWTALVQYAEAKGEKHVFPSLEIYGDEKDDPARLETRVLIGLER